MKFSEMDFLLILTTFMILLVVLMMVAIYSVFIKKKSQLILLQKIKEATFEQELAHKLERLEDLLPQHLQVYCDFSLPSYKACFFPSGFFEKDESVTI